MTTDGEPGAGVAGPDPPAWGVGPGYWDIAGQWRAVPEHTVRAVLDAMGAHTAEPTAEAPLVTVDQQGPWPNLPAGELALEGGGTVPFAAPESPERPQELPIGYHLLQRVGGGEPLTVAVCPPRCPSPPPGRTWGWSTQLYAARSGASWGIGDFADLGRLVDVGREPWSRLRTGQPVACPGAGTGPRTEPLFPELEVLPEPPLHQG